VVARSFDVGNKSTANALNSVSPGLVEWLFGGDVVVDFGLGQFTKSDLALDRRTLQDSSAPGQCEGSHDRVSAPGERLEHPARVVVMGGLFQNLSAAHHDGVGADHD